MLNLQLLTNCSILKGVNNGKLSVARLQKHPIPFILASEYYEGVDDFDITFSGEFSQYGLLIHKYTEPGYPAGHNNIQVIPDDGADFYLVPQEGFGTFFVIEAILTSWAESRWTPFRCRFVNVGKCYYLIGGLI